jgi:triosephosphate isomerase
MPDRRPYIAGNWKMHKTRAEARAYVEQLLPLIEGKDAVEVGIAAPFTALETCVEAAKGSQLRVLAQNAHEEGEGPFTGEVSTVMLTDVGVHGVVLGHSKRRRYFCETDKALQRKLPAVLAAGLEPILCVGELEEEREQGETERRQYFCETDKALQRKLPAVLAAGLEPILCVGELEEEREQGETERRLRHQVQEAFEDVDSASCTRVVIAYEPVWAIGTGLVATPEQAQEACAFIRALVRDKYGDLADQVRIQYGGSVNDENAPELLGLPDIDGALVGGASLDPAKFARIIDVAVAV